MEISRGDIVTVALQGSYGKPRPAVVVQSNRFPTRGSVTLCPLTTHLVDAPLFRLDVAPDASNGLKQPSQVMIDKIISIPRAKLDEHLGRLTDKQMLEINRALALWIGLV